MVTNASNADMAHVAISQTEVVQSLDRSTTMFNKGMPGFFDEFAADATIFMADSTEPIKGREAYRNLYNELLSRASREKTILDRKIQIVGDKAVVTQKAMIKEGDSIAYVFQTLIYGQTSEGLKVQHSQTSMLTQPNNDRATVTVVREAIAPSAPVLGVAQ
jgi:ketosteroid isomerase-like protein